MSNKVVLITGGSSGIGKAIGLYLVARGFLVFGTTRDPGRYPQFSDFELIAAEMREPASIEKAVSQVLAKAGRIDVLINNAGVGITGPVEEIPREEALKVLEVNLLGPVSMIRAVLPGMRAQKSGLVINITSIAGYMGLPFRGYYSASKGALDLLTESIRMETKGSGIYFTSVAPGDFATNIATGRYHAPVLKDSPYCSAYTKSLELMDSHVSQGQDPKKVAEKVYKIIRGRPPGVHYSVGRPLQRFSIILKKILPDKLYEKLLLNHYKL
jgi:NAD(P)-dependent dehydrogenase (short-subunit alcohol dehydrogenase family)